MKTTRERLLEIYRLLFGFFGPQHWWPGETPFEIAVGAILTQNTSWSHVEKAIANIKAADRLDACSLHSLDMEQLEPLIHPAGYFRVKAKRLRNFTTWLCDHHDSDMQALEDIATGRLREELLAISGIGPETADSILLYALNRPIFVVDTYTARVMVRHGLIPAEGLDYSQLQDLFMANLEPDVALFNEFHALLVMAGKDYCKPRPKCPACPLTSLPHRIDIECS
ncbi:MAG TPA: endonuclease III domain-containing protein [Sedimentisphaerales bacterium]|nr:endonuclease III domain-containing protein [Sedimentisphaerales bacterium]